MSDAADASFASSSSAPFASPFSSVPSASFALRSLRVFADGREIAQSCRIRLSLMESMSLLPALYSLEIENLSEASEALLSAASIVEVHSGSTDGRSSKSPSANHSGSVSDRSSFSPSSHTGSSILASGSVLSVFPRIQSGRRILSVSFSPGWPLWQSAVSLSLTGGMRVSDTIRAILEASGTSVRLSAFLAEDRSLSQPQVFFGRTCDALRLLAESVRARICLTPAGLCVVDPSLQAPTLFLPEDALRSDPVFLPGRCILSTEAAGWPLGTCLQFNWKGSSHQGLLSARMLNLDNGDGPWQSQLEVMLSRQISRFPCNPHPAPAPFPLSDPYLNHSNARLRSSSSASLDFSSSKPSGGPYAL